MQHLQALQLIATIAKRKSAWAMEAILEVAEEALGEYPEPAVIHTVVPMPALAPNRAPRKTKAPKRETAKPSAETEAAPSDVSDRHMQVLRFLESNGAAKPAAIADKLFKSATMAGPLAGKVLPAMRLRGLVEESDGFWRLSEKGAEVALDA